VVYISIMLSKAPPQRCTSLSTTESTSPNILSLDSLTTILGDSQLTIEFIEMLRDVSLLESPLWCAWPVKFCSGCAGTKA